jgi:hypothetical protein
VFPQIEIVEAKLDAGLHPLPTADCRPPTVSVTIRNAGPHTIRTRTYGEPEYRLIAKQFDGDTQVDDRWLALPRDVGPGETATIAFPHRQHATTLWLYHALQDVPMLEPEPFAEVALVR